MPEDRCWDADEGNGAEMLEAWNVGGQEVAGTKVNKYMLRGLGCKAQGFSLCRKGECTRKVS